VSTQGLRGGAAHRAVGFLDPLFLVTIQLISNFLYNKNMLPSMKIHVH